MDESLAARVCEAGEPGTSRIRESRFDDYDKIIALQQRNGLTPRSYASWVSLWRENPAYRPGEPIGWVLETPAGEIGGYIGNLPLAYRFKRRELRAATVYSWAADTAFRGYSLALLDRLVRQPGIDLIVCTTPNAAAARAFDAFQFRKVPAGKWDKCWFWITGHIGFAQSALRAERIWCSRALSYPLAAALYTRDRLRQPQRGATHAAGLELLTRFDARFERFWRELAEQERGKLTAVRDRETLEWHFGRALDAGDAWIVAAPAMGKLAAFAILDRQDHSALDLKRIRLVDFQALRGFEHLLHPVLGRALEHCRAEGAHVLENAGCWLGRWGAAAPYRRAMKTWGFYYKARHEELAAQLEDPAVWAPSAFDGDSSI